MPKAAAAKPKRATVTVRIDEDLVRYLEGRVKKGKFRSVDDAVAAGVRSLKDDVIRRRETIEWLRREIAIGLAEADRGELHDAEQVMREIREKLEGMRKNAR